MKATTKSMLVSSWLIASPATAGVALPTDLADYCPDDVVCFEPESQYFDSENLEPLLRMLGLRGDEPFSCEKIMRQYQCVQQSVRDIPTLGFVLTVSTWSAKDDIFSIRCNCLSAETRLPDFDLEQEQAALLASRFVEANLLSDPATAIESLGARLLLAANPAGRTPFNLVWEVSLGFQTPERKPAVLNLHVDTKTGRVVRAIDTNDAIDRKGFPTRPWDELRRRLSASPKDLALFRETQAYAAFRGRGDVEARFQDTHRSALGEIDPDGESYYLAVLSAPMSIEEVLALLDADRALIHGLSFWVGKDGQLYLESITGLACFSADLRGAVGEQLSRQVQSPHDWYVPEFLGVTSDQHVGRSVEGIRFAYVELQANHLEAVRLWNDTRGRLIALTPLTGPGRGVPLPRDDMQCPWVDGNR